MMVKAYREMAGAPICIHPTVAEIFLFRATRIKLMGKKKKLANNETYKTNIVR